MQLTDAQKGLIKEYGALFSDTGGNDVIELIERKDIDAFSNIVGYVLQSCCISQLRLLEQLRECSLLLDMNPS